MSDVFTDAINSASGRLVEILLKAVPKGRSEIPSEVRDRLNILVAAPGKAGHLARVRLAADIGFLFDRAPDWTAEHLVPLFSWSSPEAIDLWSARKYSNFIGSPELFGLLKEPFLEIFSRTDLADEDVRSFASWIAAILIANRKEANYPLSSSEARSALRHGGSRALASVGHYLAVKMERTKAPDKAAQWKSIIGPVLQALWPLDVELQDHATTFKLIQLSLASGDAFSDVADVITPFLQSEERNTYISVFSIGRAPDALYAAAPRKIMDIVSAIVGNAPPSSIYSLTEVLNRLRASAPELANDRKFQRLLVAAAPA